MLLRAFTHLVGRAVELRSLPSDAIKHTLRLRPIDPNQCGTRCQRFEVLSYSRASPAVSPASICERRLIGSFVKSHPGVFAVPPARWHQFRRAKAVPRSSFIVTQDFLRAVVGCPTKSPRTKTKAPDIAWRAR